MLAMLVSWQQLAPQADASLGQASAQGSETWSKVHAAIRVANYAGALKALKSHIQAHPNDHMAYDLSCLCALHCSDYQQALADALQCTALNPGWARGWARLGAAQLCMGHPAAAEAAFAKGLQLGCSEELQAGLELAKKAKAAQGPNRRAAMHE